MKAYKIDLSGFTGKVREVVSEAVQKKAFDLGLDTTGRFCALDKPFLFIGSAGGTGWDDDLEYFNGKKDTLITADAFLALTTAKDEPSFKPFDKVLVRDTDGDVWNADFYSHYGDQDYPYYCMTSWYNHCIPYEGNEALLGTTDSPK